MLAVWDNSGTPIDIQPFSQPVGPAQPTSNDPAELFRLFFTDEIVGAIVLETNRYAAQCLAGKPTTWATNEEEIRAYLWVLYIHGIGEGA